MIIDDYVSARFFWTMSEQYLICLLGTESNCGLVLWAKTKLLGDCIQLFIISVPNMCETHKMNFCGLLQADRRPIRCIAPTFDGQIQSFDAKNI